MKILVFSDVHIRDFGSFNPFNITEENGYTKELNNIMRGADFVVDQIKQYKPHIVVLAGDLFHTPEYLTSTTLKAGGEFLYKIKKACEDPYAMFVGFPGNHDMYSQSPLIHHLQSLSIYFDKMIEEYTEIEYDGYPISIVPFNKHTHVFYENFIKAIQGPSKLMLTHFDFGGCRYETGRMSDASISASLVSKTTISGDIHVAQSLGHLHYCGSLVQNRFNRSDKEGVGGCILFDTETSKVTHIPNTYSRHYYKIDDYKKIESYLPGDGVFQISDPNASKEEIDKFLLNKNYYYQISKPFTLQQQSSVQIYENPQDEYNPKRLMRSWIEKDNPTKLDFFDSIMETRPI